MTHFFIATLFILSTNLFAAPAQKNTAVVDSLQSIINQHYNAYAELEHFTALQVSVQTEGRLKTYVKGKRSLSEKSPDLGPDDLFEIGSITKSFTSALALLAEAQDKFQLSQLLSQYLKAYPHWGAIRLSKLLNMSSGLPNYSDAPKINYLMSKNIKQFWNPAELIALVYSEKFNPPLKSGYFYSNSGYILMDMILSDLYKRPFKELLENKIIKPLALKNTFYPIPNFSRAVLSRMVEGYSYNVYSNPELLGENVTENNLSWAGAAGALVANSEDLVHWIETLFIKDTLLNAEQKKKMQSLISVKTGKPLEQTNEQDPQGFGLGIIQAFDPKLGRYWFYEGETLGYRALYFYLPCNQTIITALFNSATNSENDHASLLIKNLYKSVLKQNKQLICKTKKSIRIRTASARRQR